MESCSCLSTSSGEKKTRGIEGMGETEVHYSEQDCACKQDGDGYSKVQELGGGG